MLYFSIVPDGRTPSIVPHSSEQPYHLCVAKSLDDNEIVYDKEEGVHRLYFTFTEPSKWQEETRTISDHSGGYQMYNSTEECVLLENGLFFYEKEYTMEFLKSRFADDLNSIRLDSFDTGVLWHALLQINELVVKFNNHTPAVSDKEMARLTRAIGSVIHSTERSISLVTKLIKSAHVVATNCPESIHNTRSYTINKAYLYYAYLFLLPLKEFYAGKVLPHGREHGFVDYLLDCCPSINIHSFTTAYDLFFGEETTRDLLSKLIHSPGRNVSNTNVSVSAEAMPLTDSDITLAPESSAEDIRKQH